MTLNELLNTICEEYDCSACESDEFAYYYSESKINYTLNDDAAMANAFRDFAIRNGLNEKVDCFTISFFHELGHNETLDEVEDEYSGNKNELSLEEYFSLEEEWLATDWAIDFCNSHLDLVEKIEGLE